MVNPNRLIKETSPYLRQHAHNPVDWYSWGEEAQARAVAEDKPILLSIGYSACHWCHVMEEESFENPEIAGLMNENFVCIKVDREERPDLDSIYMEAVQGMSGRGGWPLTVFLTPEGKPFFGGTYFPPEDRQGMPGFPTVLKAVVEGYRKRRTEVDASAERITGYLQEMGGKQKTQEPLTLDMLHQAYKGLVPQFDGRLGGFGTAPKFPQPMVGEFLLRYWRRTGDKQALHMVELTLEKMAKGGIYDQLGGGFHRYSTDPYWLVPHFEKMLYDNALLSRLYLHAYQATGNSFYQHVVRGTLDYVLREMRDPQGGFYSTQDADSEGEEGTYYVWSYNQLLMALGREEGEVFCHYYGASAEGNFNGQNILHLPRNVGRKALETGAKTEEVERIIERGRDSLLEIRQRRVAPGRDEKIITAWNGLMLSSMAEAASVLDDETYRQAAVACASFILARLKDADGRLLRTHKDGQSKLKGYLEDYAFLIDGLLALHEATFDLSWLEEARALADQMLALFWEESPGLFYDTGRDHETLIARPQTLFDNATPCGSSVAADVLQRLALLTGEKEYSSRAALAIRFAQKHMTRAPVATGHWFSALDFYLDSPKEIAILGQRQHPKTRGMLAVLHGQYLPNKVVIGQEGGPRRKGFPLLEGREQINFEPTAFVCRNYSCNLPATEPEELASQLQEP